MVNPAEETLKQDDTAATQRAAEAAHARIDDIANAGAKAEQRVRSVARDTRAAAKDATQKAESASTEALSRAKDSIRENPLMAAGAAFAVGFVLSALIRK